MTVAAGFEGLLFPCECVSAKQGGYSDPWAEITKNKLLPNGTKEEILNIVAHEPNTITQIAEQLGLSAPSVHTHISEMVRSERLAKYNQLLRISEELGAFSPWHPLTGG